MADEARIGRMKAKKIIDPLIKQAQATHNEIDESSDDENSKMKSYITRQFKKFMKNANVKGFDKDYKQSSYSQFKSQDRGKKDAKDGSQYTVPSRPKL